ncbi:hypothetical protein DRN74_06240 [Candidatus Micrarchaeota archaeon]|nr:MAG: hypothetical protein DRN74_06240 [Candidatus Micrarchaeota archaeon]
MDMKPLLILNQIISIWFNYKYAAIYRGILNVRVVFHFRTRTLTEFGYSVLSEKVRQLVLS